MTMTDAVPLDGPRRQAAEDRRFFGHPRALGVLVFAEAWERFSYYGMQSLLVLYMVDSVLLPDHRGHVAGFAALRALIESVSGPLTVTALASNIFGLYAACIYVTPLLGGMLADRLFGKTWMIVAGAVVMAAGHFLMAFDWSFLLALACILVGTGGFKGNIMSQVGQLYTDGDSRRDEAFQMMFIAINAAMVAAPLICGTLGEKLGWDYGFAAAGVGMLLGLGVYWFGRHLLPAGERGIGTAPRAPLSPLEVKRVLLLIVLLPVLSVAMVGNFQLFNAYMIWAREHYDLNVLGFAVPVTWLGSWGSVLAILAISGCAAFWTWWGKRRREPGDMTKMWAGALIMAVAMLVLALASRRALDGHRLSLGWDLLMLLFDVIGYANFVPISMAFYARVAPRSVNGLMVSLCLLEFFGANLLVGRLGGYLEPLGGVNFWLLHAGLGAAAAMVLFAIDRLAGRVLDPAAAMPAAPRRHAASPS